MHARFKWPSSPLRHRPLRVPLAARRKRTLHLDVLASPLQRAAFVESQESCLTDKSMSDVLRFVIKGGKRPWTSIIFNLPVFQVSTEKEVFSIAMDATVSYSLYNFRLASTLCGIPLILWAVSQFRKIFRRHKTPRSSHIEDLDNIPGPPAPSFIQGSLGDLYSLDGWEYQRKIAEQCKCSATIFCRANAIGRLTAMLSHSDGSAIKIKGPFGVCIGGLT